MDFRTSGSIVRCLFSKCKFVEYYRRKYKNKNKETCAKNKVTFSLLIVYFSGQDGRDIARFNRPVSKNPCRLKIISRYLVQNCVMLYCASLRRMCLVSCFVSRARMFKLAGKWRGKCVHAKLGGAEQSKRWVCTKK